MTFVKKCGNGDDFVTRTTPSPTPPDKVQEKFGGDDDQLCWDETNSDRRVSVADRNSPDKSREDLGQCS